MLNLLFARQFDLFLVIAVILVIAITVHEFAHALAADLQGDRTARLAGRLTLNPLRHLDPIGSLALVLAGFGWGKPVPFSPAALRNRRLGPAIVGLAGPASNLVQATVFAALFAHLVQPGFFADALLQGVFLNVLLAVFNLLPIPPLDGSRLLAALLPPSRHNIIYFLDQWGFLILLVLVFTVLGSFFGVVVPPIVSAILALVGG